MRGIWFLLKVLSCEKLYRNPGSLESGIQDASPRNLAGIRIPTTFTGNYEPTEGKSGIQSLEYRIQNCL